MKRRALLIGWRSGFDYFWVVKSLSKKACMPRTCIQNVHIPGFKINILNIDIFVGCLVHVPFVPAIFFRFQALICRT